MPSVDPKLRAGTQFDSSLLPEKASVSKWFRIPHWMAGVWHREFLYDRSGKKKDSRTRTFGFQTDAVGAVWHWVRVPFRQVNDLRAYQGYSSVRDESMVERTEDSFTLRTNFTSWIVSKRTNIVFQVTQCDQIDVFTKDTDGSMKVKSSLSSYDQLGRKIGKNYNSHWQETIVKGYVPIDEYKGVNVKESFIQYLKTQGTNALIPH